MKMRVRVALVLSLLALAEQKTAAQTEPMEFSIDGVTRTALVHVPAAAAGAKLPLVFVFHGHGGSSRNALNTFKIDRLWPDAISIYPQGLNTPGQLTDPEGLRSGWQKGPGDQGDRDLHFFEAMLARLQSSYAVDPQRIYCVGHSNGAGFTYLLWLLRPKVFAAVAPCAGAARYAEQLTPKPAMILGGQNDPIVKFEWQELMMAAVRKINGCDAAGQPWGTGCTLYPSKSGFPLVTFIHSGGHMIDPAEPALIVKFFQENPGAARPAG